MRLVAVLATAIILAGCSSVPTATAPASADASDSATESTPDPSGASPADPLPRVDLNSDLLYQLMAAEIAVQRGDAGDAYATFLAEARQTRDPRLARRAAEVAIGARALAQALDASRLWRELAPHSVEAQQAVGALLVANGRYEESEPLFAQQIKAAAAPLNELARVQRTLARAPDRAAAFDLLQRLAAPYQDDARHGADVHLTLAHGAQAAGLNQRAVEEARIALAQRPGFEIAALSAAQYLARPGGRDDAAGRAQALVLLANFLVSNPASVNARMTYARLLVADNKVPAARVEFERVLAADDRNLDALYAAGVLAMDSPPPRTVARSYLTRYLQVLEETPGADRDPDQAHLNLARLAEEEHNYPEALEWLNHIDGGDQYLNARMRKSIVLGKMNRIDESRALLAATPVNGPEEKTQLTLTEAQILRDAHRYNESFDLLAAALQRTPEDSSLLYDTAMAAERLDRVDVMEEHLRHLMLLKPEDAHAFNALGYSLADRNLRLNDAYDLVTQALKLAPDDAFIIDSMGWVCFRQGKFAQAREYLEQAWKLRPHAEVGAHLGEVLWQQGDRDSARRVWREARKLEPESDTLNSTLARLKAGL